MPPSVNAPDCPVSDFYRRLKATKALRGVEILAGSASLPRQTGPGRIVIWPTDGEWKDPSDRSVSIADIDQQVVARCWGKGSSGGGADEAQLADWNATWQLFLQLTRAMEEQAQSPANPDSPGLFWRTEGVIGWNVGEDTAQQGTSISVLFKVTCPVLAVSDDPGHVGENWPEGEAERLEIQGVP